MKLILCITTDEIVTTPVIPGLGKQRHSESSVSSRPLWSAQEQLEREGKGREKKDEPGGGVHP